MNVEPDTTDLELDRSDGRAMVVNRITYPTTSFALTTHQIAWLNSEAHRLGISRSELVRGILNDARSKQDGEAA